MKIKHIPVKFTPDEILHLRKLLRTRNVSPGIETDIVLKVGNTIGACTLLDDDFAKKEKSQ